MKLEPEVAYLLGALRDSTIDIRKGKNYEIKIAQKESEWLSVLQKIFLKHFNNSGKITQHSKGAKILRITGKETVYKVLEISQMQVPQVKWNTPKIIEEQKNLIQLQYLKGFFDAEGGLPRDPKTAKQKYISFSQKNKQSLEFLRILLIENGFRPTNLTICGGVWEFRLTRKNDIANFSIKIGSLHKDKQRKLKILERAYFPQFGGGALPGVEAAV